MAQLSYNTFPNKAFAGMLEDPSFVRNVRSYPALKAIDFGKALVWVNSGTSGWGFVKEFEQNITIETFSADFITDNVINLNVNGIAITPITYATSNAATMAALAAAIVAATTDVLSATVTSANVITIVKNPAAASVLITAYVCTGGESQPTLAETYSTNEVVIGISTRENLEPLQIGQTTPYQPNDSVNTLTDGSIWVNVAGTVDQQNGSAYAYADFTQTGILTTDPESVGSGSSVIITPSVFRSVVQNSLCVLDFHVP